LSTLDVNTPKGQKTIVQEQRAVELFCEHFPSTKYVNTPKKGSATVDSLLIKEGNLVGVVETKCRQMTRSQLEQYGDEWLVTWDKIDGARKIATSLGVSLWGFLYLVPDDLLIIVEISNAQGEFLREMRVEATQTQKTVNGGLIVRNNAYISVTGCTELTFDTMESTV